MAGLNRIVDVAMGLDRMAAAGGGATPVLSPSIVIVRECCTHYRHTASTCSRCIGVCPVGAINLSANSPVLNAMVCRECGACACVCPMDAIVLQNPTDRALAEEIAATAGRGDTVTLTCQQAAKKSPGIFVACLARLEPSLLLLAPVNGVPGIRLIAGECGQCPLGNMSPHLHTMIAHAEAVAAALGVHLWISVDAFAADIDLSRRAWFTKFLGKGQGFGRTAKIAITLSDIAPGNGDLTDDGETAVLPPEKRRRFVASLRVLAERAEDPISTNTALFPRPELDAARCVGCALCADMCPTGALVAEKGTEMLRIAYNAAACVACDLCVDVCYRQAITFYTTGDIGSILTPRPALLLERPENDDLLSSCEDKIGALLGTPVYRT